MKDDLTPCIVFLGEGPSDVNIDERSGDFAGLRPMVCEAICRHAPKALPEKWLRRHAEAAWTSDVLKEGCIPLLPSALKRCHGRVPFHAVRKAEKEFAGIANRVYLFGLAAAEAGADYAVFFHDCDRLPLADMVEAVKTGAEAARYEGMVVMTPNPTSEAWILAGLRNLRGAPSERVTAENAGKFEAELRGNDKNPRSAKARLAQWVMGKVDAMALDPDGYRDCVETLDREAGWESAECLPSMRAFVESIAAVSEKIRPTGTMLYSHCHGRAK